MLKFDPPNIAAKIPANTAVIIPWSGVAPLAKAKEIESGTEMMLTATQDFRLCLIWDQSDETEIIRYTLIKIKKRKCE
jgi:hypothetical protein